ncbi:MAG: DUF1127 domain-containing protein [Salinisphaera sp.]|uniref:DUF1127 domain-containing protein n=1 Tax=Salinisphaera sp. TaxID=1914330 RepID=UPI003C79A1CD
MDPIQCPDVRRVSSQPNPRAFPDLYMPAMPPLQLIARIRRALDRRACQRQLRTLLNADDRQLADLGLSRERIRHALRHAGDDDPCHVLAKTMRADAGVGTPTPVEGRSRAD